VWCSAAVGFCDEKAPWHLRCVRRTRSSDASEKSTLALSSPFNLYREQVCADVAIQGGGCRCVEACVGWVQALLLLHCNVHVQQGHITVVIQTADPARVLLAGPVCDLWDLS
jgi:hypothetical protein